MSKKQILKYNSRQFLIDIKRVSEVMIHSDKTMGTFKIRKLDVLKQAEETEIKYYITDKIFVSKRDSMVII